jgi:hypothetical protein
VSTIIGGDAKFQMSLENLSAGSYVFSVYSEDKDGRRSSLLTFPIILTDGATTNVSGIFISPTIDVDKSDVRRGDNLAIFGQSFKNSEVTISVNSEKEIFVKTEADEDGIYLYNFDTSFLEKGRHSAKSKSAADSQISSFGKAVSFTVGDKSVVKGRPKVTIGDSSGDNRVNLVDFSVAAYWYKRPSPPAKIDLNGDGEIGLVDFSIMAYYWTG